MAYMTKEGNGPYPNKAGEYCGNHPVNAKPILSFHESPDEAKRHHEEYLSTMRFGKPHSCEAGTTKEMEAKGYVGLYLKKDDKFSNPGDIEVPTPQELMEPT